MKFRLPVSIRYIISIYLVGMVFFTLFRFGLVFTNTGAINEIPGKWGIMAQSMFMGVRFDTVISGYILALPSVILILLDAFKRLSRRVLLITTIFASILYIISFFGCAADIPYFNTYNTRLNITILSWTASPMFMIKLIFQEASYLLFFILFLLASALFVFFLVRIYRRYWKKASQPDAQSFSVLKAIVCIVFLALEFLGIRGRIDEKSPIVVGTAYFSKYDFANQAGLNPIYTFMQSWLDSKKEESQHLDLMKDTDAITLARYYLHADTSGADTSNPFVRVVHGDSTTPRYNIVVVMMEAMSADFMSRYGNKRNLTPCLDSLALNGAVYDNFYSAGIHTFNGIYSIMYSFPGLLAKHTMEGTVIPAYTGLPYTASRHGYKTLYFTTHDDQFDNVGGFITSNNIDTLISKKDYPSSEVLTTLGVPDHYMLNYSIPVLSDVYNSGRNFCAFMMTASNHTPYTVPPDIPFKPTYKQLRGGCVEYADWSIGQFMKTASTQKWFSNTIFVFVADHGAKEGTKYNGTYIGYSHIPFIIYAPALIQKPVVMTSPGGQIDIYPTIAGLLGWSYTNNTMGIDLWHGSRKYMFFSQDNKVGVADTEQLYIWHKDGHEDMFRLSNNKVQIPIKNNPKADSMKLFAFSMLQSTQWAIDNHKTGPVK